MADDETYRISHLQMDRGEPLGNSEDADERRALHTLVRNSPDQPIPIVGSFSFSQGFSTLSLGYPTQISVDSSGATQLLPANPARLYALISNYSDTPIFIQFGASAAVGEGLRISSGANFTISGFELWLGAVFAVSIDGPVNISVTEATL